LAAALAAGCAAVADERRATFGIRFPPPEAAEKPTAIVFMVDGVNADVFRRLLDDGRLPNLRRYFVDRGLYVERCVVSLPSVTLSNETSLVTGLWPGHHGVTGNTWFDRNRLVLRNYEELAEKNLVDGDYLAPTIFERLSDVTTLSLFFQPHRGAAQFVENLLSAGPPYFFGWYDLVDRISLWRFVNVAEIAKVQGEFPAIVFSYLLSPDMEAYRHGISSDAYRAALDHTDAQVGRILRDLESAGRLDRTVLVMVSDHGMTDVVRHRPIYDFFRDELRLAVSRVEGPWEQTSFENRIAYYQSISCVLAGSGDRYWAAYLRKPRAVSSDAKPPFENWLVRPSAEDLRDYPTRDGHRVDLIARLLAEEAVDVVAWRAGPDHVNLATRRGVAEAARSGPDGCRYSLRTIRGDDPLGYDGEVPLGMLDGSAHDASEWLAATAGSSYPDLVPQIMAYFDAERSGDLVVFAAPGWDFGKVNKAGHGGLRPEEMFTIFLAAGPGVPHARWSGLPTENSGDPGPARTVDLVPTLLGLLGRPVPPGLDGRNVLRQSPITGAGPGAGDPPPP